MRSLTRFLAILGVIALPAVAQAQQVSFAGMRGNPKAPVEVSADQLKVNQENGQAVFSGNVVVVQDKLKLTAAQIEVQYVQGDRTKVSQLHASGGVTLVSPTEAAEAQDAVYDVPKGTVVMTGKVLLTQGNNVMSGNRLDVDLSTGEGQMQGRVRTILKPGTAK